MANKEFGICGYCVILFSVMDKLPPTSYIRFVDIWLIAGQFLPFLEVVLLTVKELFFETETINHHGSLKTVKIKPKTKEVYVKSPEIPFDLNEAQDEKKENKIDSEIAVTNTEVQWSCYLSIHFRAGKHKMHVFLCYPARK